MNKKEYPDEGELFKEEEKPPRKIFLKILLVLLGIGLAYEIGNLFYDYYLMKEEIKARTELFIETGSTLSGGNYVYESGGDVTSSDSDVVSVASDGTVIAKSGGTTTVTITKDEEEIDEDSIGTSSSSSSSSSLSSSNKDEISEIYDSLDYGESVEVEITVNEAVESVSLDNTNINILVGETATLKATISPSTATNQNVTWSSSDSSIVSVSNGKVTGKKKGSAVITVTTKDGKKTAKCTVNVSEDTTVTNSIVLASNSGTLYVGDTYTLVPTVSPDTSLSSSITYSSSDSSVASVDSSGKITAKKSGTAVITLSISKEEISSKYTVTVKNVDVTSISVSPSSISMEVGDSINLTTVISPTNATNKSITYSSSDSSIASVDSSGKVTAKKSGNATITVKSSNNKSASVKITVRDKVVAVTSVSASIKSSSINIGSTATITSSVSPSNATNKTLTYTSSNTSVATVDSSGKVTGVSAGSATITIAASSGVKTSVNITVNTIKVTSITLDKSSLSLDVGSSSTISVKSISPSNATNKNVTYSSSNTSVATVSSSGVVVGVKAGSATITVKSSDGGASATVKVTVSNVKVKSITLSSTSTSLVVGKSTTISVKSVSPSNATNKNVTWTSSNTSVATVSSGGKITAVKEGSATITATASDGSGVSSKVKVTVTKISVSSVTIKGSLGMEVEKGVLEKGGSVTYTASVSPSNATYPTVTWSSSDTSVATVNSSGKVTGKKKGTAKITATADGVKTTFTVYVSAAGDHVYFIDIQDTDDYIGDATLIESGGKYAMIDTGKGSSKSRKRIQQFLNDMGVKTLQWVLLTHFHADHYGGFAGLYSAGVTINKVYAKDYVAYDSNYDSSSYSSVKEVRTARSNNWTSLKEKFTKYNTTLTLLKKDGTEITLGNFTWKMYNTANAFEGKKSACEKSASCNENTNSLIALGKVNGKYLYFAADLQNDSNITSGSTWVYDWTNKVMSDNGITSVAIMKANHHGITANNPENAIKKINPDYAVVTNTQDHTFCVNHCTYYYLKSNVGKTGSKVYYSGNGTVIFTISSSGSVSMDRQLAALGDDNSESCSSTQKCGTKSYTK